MLLLVIFVLLLRLVDGGLGSSDEEYGNEVTAGPERIQSNELLASSESAKCPMRETCFENIAVDLSIQKPFSCSQCDKQFTHICSLRRHQRIHSGKKPHDCPECGKQFSRTDMLQRHQQTHSDVKLFLCAACGKQFTCAYGLRVHQRTHTGEKPFVCLDCGKQFAHANNLLSHQRTHRGEKPFVCTECGKQFTRNDNLLAHERIHTGMKQFRCTECGKNFTRRDSLRHHRRLHNSEKLLKCSKCGKLFARAVQLRHHLRKKHSGLENSTNNPSIGYSENSTVIESLSLFQTVFENSADNSSFIHLKSPIASNNPPIAQIALRNLPDSSPFAQIKNLTTMEPPFFLYPAQEIPMDDTSSVDGQDFTEPLLLQKALDNPSLPKNPTKSPFFVHLRNPATFGHPSYQKPIYNPFLMQTEKETVLQKKIDLTPFPIRAEGHVAPEVSVDSALFVETQENVLRNADISVADRQYPSGNAFSCITYLECPVCFGQFGERDVLEDHIRNNGCSLYPMDGLPHLEIDDNDDATK